MKREDLPRFFLAVDASDEVETWKNINKIKGVSGNYGIKINLDLMFKDLSIISRVANTTGVPIFADLKIWNGKRTMCEVVKAVADQGASMVNFYALADSMIPDAVEEAKKAGVITLGVTVLTHYNEDYCQKFHHMSMDELVRLLAETALERGCDGYILPGTCLDTVAGLGGVKFNPATRPDWFADKKTNAQEQIMKPGEAIRKGADIVSCGSPVFKSPDPREALQMILEEIENASQ